MTHRTGRRMFLRGAGGFALGLPMLPSLLPRNAEAGLPAAPKRFVAIESLSGLTVQDLYPSVAPAGYQLRDTLFDNVVKQDHTVYLHERVPGTPYGRAALTDFAGTAMGGGLSNILAPELQPYLAKCLLLRGIDVLPYCGHNDGAMLGNYNASTMSATWDIPPVPTIDQILAYSAPFATQLKSLHVGVGWTNTFSFSDYGIVGGPVEQMSLIPDPRNIWTTLFDGFTPTGERPVEDPNRMLVDRVYEDYTRIRQHTRLSAADRILLDRHLTFLDELQRSLEFHAASCSMPPEQPESIPNSEPTDVSDVEQIRRTWELVVDLAAAAILCDVTRVVTIGVSKALSDGRGSWAGYYHSGDEPGSWHGDAHAAGDPVADTNLRHLNRWILTDIFVRLLERLDVEEEPGQTVLDNSLVYWSNEIGFNHANLSLPTLIAGSAGGFLSTGQYIDYIDWDGPVAGCCALSQQGGTTIQGIAHNRLLVTILQAMGLQPQDYERNGWAGYGYGGQAGRDPSFTWDYEPLDQPLPGIVAV